MAVASLRASLGSLESSGWVTAVFVWIVTDWCFGCHSPGGTERDASVSNDLTVTAPQTSICPYVSMAVNQYIHRGRVKVNNGRPTYQLEQVRMKWTQSLDWRLRLFWFTYILRLTPFFPEIQAPHCARTILQIGYGVSLELWSVPLGGFIPNSHQSGKAFDGALRLSRKRKTLYLKSHLLRRGGHL